jgi:calcium-dependent protein kinase
VAYCHQNNVVHRDLKPENIILETIGKDILVKLIDFGTSVKFDLGEKFTKPFGSVYYIAPEVINRNYDAACDLWSCGVILYIILTGQPPFSGKDDDKIIKAIRSNKLDF